MSNRQLLDEQLDRIDSQLERMSIAIVKGFDDAKKGRQAIRDEVRQSIDIYARQLTI